MREDMACCLMKLLHRPIVAMTDDQSQVYAPQHTRVGGQTSNRNADMVIYSVHLLLVRRELAERTLLIMEGETARSESKSTTHLKSQEDCVCLGSQTHRRRTLLHGLQSILDLV